MALNDSNIRVHICRNVIAILYLITAQDLLSQWMEEKVNLIGGLDPEIDCHYDDDDWEKHEIQSDVKREWDNLLANNYEEYGLPLSSRPSEKHSEGFQLLFVKIKKNITIRIC